jgi:ribosomal protein S21
MRSRNYEYDGASGNSQGLSRHYSTTTVQDPRRILQHSCLETHVLTGRRMRKNSQRMYVKAKRRSTPPRDTTTTSTVQDKLRILQHSCLETHVLTGRRMRKNPQRMCVKGKRRSYSRIPAEGFECTRNSHNYLLALSQILIYCTQ